MGKRLSVSMKSIIGVSHVQVKFNRDQRSRLNPEDLKKANISCALVAEIHKPDRSLFAMFLHIVRDTYYGCEMRNRFRVIKPDESTVRGMIKHNLEELGNLAEILPRLYCTRG